MAPDRLGESPGSLDRLEHPNSATRPVGHHSMTVCSPLSRRGATHRPRFAGLTALTPAARTVTDQTSPTSRGTVFPQGGPGLTN